MMNIFIVAVQINPGKQKNDLLQMTIRVLIEDLSNETKYSTQSNWV